MKVSNPSLGDSFLQYFAPELASTKQSLSDAFKLRYRVYCEEFGYERASDFPDQLECDPFDAHSFCFLIRHKASGLAAGCIRVVLAGNNQRLPLEVFCLDSIRDSYRDLLGGDRGRLCEFSRLAVSADFRRRPRESMSRLGLSDAEPSAEEERSFPLIAVAAFLGAFAVSEMAGRDQVFAMMEPFLPRMLRQAGIVPETAGNEIDYHGTRSAYYITTQSAIESLKPDLLLLYTGILESLTSQDLPGVVREPV